MRLNHAAYTYLKALERPGDVIRLARPKRSPMELVGASHIEPGYTEILGKMRKADERRWKEIQRRRRRAGGA